MQDGFILVNKDRDWTSFDIVAKLRGILNTKKIGHAGTLDPFATGLLIVAIGKATKLLEFVSTDYKTYKGTIDFSFSTNTYDVTGEVSSKVNNEGIDINNLKTIINNSFKGKVMQKPPMFSAIKINGQKMYHLARQGKEVELEHRPIEITKFEIYKNEKPYLIDFEVSVSSGTYIRSIAYDLGKLLNRDSHLLSLNRTSYGINENIKLETAKNIKDITMQDLRPISDIVNLPIVELSDVEIKLLLDGKKLVLDNVAHRLIVVNSKHIASLVIIKDNDGYIISKNLVSANSK